MTDPQAFANAADESDVVTSDRSSLDLARIAADLDGVETALRRLDEGTYWTDEVTGAELCDELLATDPIARRAEQR